MSPIDIARVCHEVNRSICLAQGDDSQKPWDQAPGWARDSAIRGVIFRIKNPQATPEQQHEEWMKTKLADGWIYGPTKGEVQVELPREKDEFGVEIGEQQFRVEKHHPCLRPYADLSFEQRIKDVVFSAIVNSLKDH